MTQPSLLLNRTDVERLLDVEACVTAVEKAFLIRGTTDKAQSVSAGLSVAAGTFHAKMAQLDLSRPYFVAKVNANFPGNPAQRGLPTVQGVLILFDSTDGAPLAVMDSGAITIIRTAAASAVAARYLARKNARVATFVGCGAQAHSHLAAISEVRPLERAFVFDIDPKKAESFAAEAGRNHQFSIEVASDLRSATKVSDIIVTMTSATVPFLGLDDVSPGTFIAAVGADSAKKNEIAPELMQKAAVVVDDLKQCESGGDLHHSILAGLVKPENVRATLAEVVAGLRQGRLDDDETIVFDSTGVAIEDVAAAAIVYERAVESNAGIPLRL